MTSASCRHARDRRVRCQRPRVCQNSGVTNDAVRELNERVQVQRQRLDPFYAQVERVLAGQRTLVDRIVVALLTGGHLLIEGVPGLAKTLTVRTIARTLRLSFQRIQFTPDLLPADVLGTQIYNPRTV